MRTQRGAWVSQGLGRTWSCAAGIGICPTCSGITSVAVDTSLSCVEGGGAYATYTVTNIGENTITSAPTDAMPGASARNTRDQRPSDGFGGVVPVIGRPLVVEVLMAPTIR